MLSIATSKLRVAVEVAQKSHNGGRVTKCRMYSTDAPKGGAGSGKSAGGEGSNHKQGSYTYKQAYENSQRYEKEAVISIEAMAPWNQNRGSLSH